jgi:hypothetical protein
MARWIGCLVPSILLFGISAAHADFVVDTNAAAGPNSVDATPIGNPAPSGNVSTTAVVHWKTAYGFGNSVPLAFACRQIVPKAVKVRYGAGVRLDAPVTWKGGDTWNHVLRDAVAPLGWHLRMSYMAVEIDK